MNVYRIANKEFIEDLSGEGARLYGGRWNRKGISMLYTSQSRSLAALEFLVHLPMSLVPKNIYIAEIEIPDTSEYEEILAESLPDNWTDYPAPVDLAKKAELWIVECKNLCCKVPSSIVEGDLNILINPKHPEWKDLSITDLKPFIYDERLLN